MSSLAQLVCLFCLSVPSLPYPQVSREAGDVRYTYEVLGRGKYLLRLSTDSAFLFPTTTCRSSLRFPTLSPDTRARAIIAEINSPAD